ncbi:Rv3235 family protein [Pseudoclavibacter alba]|uniref:Rv3235 family protein n=1 Tax=Pseudoclavibacter albus TaxID=272241 RepID=A0ABT2HUF8_9MICO|nr:Rv3235 family protein [Pseudoclavibacter alba]MCT2041944.1 Rv3235 family protein [Pseudoclavibacter alba]
MTRIAAMPSRRAAASIAATERAATLPNPEPLAGNLGRSIIEVLAGVRDIDNLARWLSDEVYRHLLARTQYESRARRARRLVIRRPNVRHLGTRVQQLTPGIAECVVLLDMGTRVRAVALRLEWQSDRWRATSFHVL